MSNAKVQNGIDGLRRLAILQLLVKYRGALNTLTMESSLRARKHHYIDRSMVNDDFRWLETRSLVDVEEIETRLLGVSITPRGERCAAGDEWVDGVDRPDRG